ncbi:DNA (cytosine-5-)-methyltransferase [Rhizobium leguminosarum]|uniref:DNA cytosine methyltransferase n=1 Tax=Rhizobium leguminosarum TaxID=384 RepID=UPI001C92AC1B|nr:DNA (cytosine-5-)-methyltransferase [Rhizobium leguminosarum]MBY3176979.1 DNA (cytosine-5-)-methyltransferase [Rhizobium leguminosarum]
MYFKSKSALPAGPHSENDREFVMGDSGRDVTNHGLYRSMRRTTSEATAIDIFCGAGGLSSALSESGWATYAAVDIDRDCLRSLEANQRKGFLRGAKLIHADIAEVRASDLRPTASPDWRPDLLAGGPPCQPFSSAGRMGGLNDPRGQLFTHFVRLAEELRPRFVLFENVAGLVTAKDQNGIAGGVLARIQSSFEEIGYACRFDLLNAADYGAPQRRVRLYMIAAYNEPLPQFPNRTHSKEGEGLPWVSLASFLKTMPSPNAADIVRPPKSKATQLAELTPGTGLKSIGIVEANRPSGHWGYRQDSFLADLSIPSRTIRAASTPDWIRLPDDKDLRRLTWKECAGLQAFPKEWEFVGTVASKFRQIGNAVQGNIGRALGATLLQAAAGDKLVNTSSEPWPASFRRRVRYTTMEEHVNGQVRRMAKESKNIDRSSEMV